MACAVGTQERSLGRGALHCALSCLAANGRGTAGDGEAGLATHVHVYTCIAEL